MENLHAHELPVPYYLSAEDKRALWSDLAGYPENQNIYCSPLEGSLLQGDICDGLDVVNVNTLERKTVRAIVLSNSCDIDPEDAGSAEKRVTYCPVMSLERFIKSMEMRGVDQQQVFDVVGSLERQRVTNIFYIPRKVGVIEASIVRFDDIHSRPVPEVVAQNPQRRLSLNQYGHYIFLVKMSIHFLRLQAGIQRGKS
jgi:hypothetical protein